MQLFVVCAESQISRSSSGSDMNGRFVPETDDVHDDRVRKRGSRLAHRRVPLDIGIGSTSRVPKDRRALPYRAPSFDCLGKVAWSLTLRLPFNLGRERRT